MISENISKPMASGQFSASAVHRSVRSDIQNMQGYVPGEQPPAGTMIKLNTNENPYPPSPAAIAALVECTAGQLRLYPDPTARRLREVAAARFGLQPAQLLAGNGSDDLLTIGIRTFVDQKAPVAFIDPSYSLYPVLARIQGARPVPIPLDRHFQLPETMPARLTGCTLLFIARPNAPTGNSFPRSRMEKLCREFSGIVWIDEAYADFADDHCLELVDRYPNVVVSRTLSKSYSLAGLRVGLVCASAGLIEQMIKVKDSYNLSLPAQFVATAALLDSKLMEANRAKIISGREVAAKALTQLGFTVLPSQANFIFVRPPIKARLYAEELRREGILIRYFPGPRTGDFVRITIGREDEMNCLLTATEKILRD